MITMTNARSPATPFALVDHLDAQRAKVHVDQHAADEREHSGVEVQLNGTCFMKRFFEAVR